MKCMRKNNDNKALVPKLWGLLWTLTRLIRVDYMYSFMLYNVIHNCTLCHLHKIRNKALYLIQEVKFCILCNTCMSQGRICQLEQTDSF